MTKPFNRFSGHDQRQRAMTAKLRAEVAEMQSDKRISIVFPWPPKELSPNGRLHWSKKAKAVRAYRSVCSGLCHEAGLHLKKHSLASQGLNLRLTYVFNPPDARKRDKDNCIGSFKAGQDAIATVVGIDDNHFVTTYAMGKPGAGNVAVTIEADT
jgi:crossover junction endodeoxyribonuclease RusA